MDAVTPDYLHVLLGVEEAEKGVGTMLSRASPHLVFARQSKVSICLYSWDCLRRWLIQILRVEGGSVILLSGE